MTVHVDRARLVQYAGASLDRNRIHWDEPFAKQVGLPDVIAHGMFTMGSAVTLVTDWVGDAGRVVEYGVRFTKPVVVPYDDRRRHRGLRRRQGCSTPRPSASPSS